MENTFDTNSFFEDFGLNPIENRDNTRSASGIFTDEKILEEAFKYYRAHSFPYRKIEVHEMMQEINALSKMDSKSLLSTGVGLLTADTFQPQRFDVAVEGKETAIKSFQDDRKLKHALELHFKNVGKIGTGYFSALTFVLGTQTASNFRPGFALYYYRKYCQKGYNVLDTSMGYGGRMVGYIASGIDGSYTAIDPSAITVKNNLHLAQTLGFEKQINVINKPVEDVDPSPLKDRFDFAFTSPPYFTKEHYGDVGEDSSGQSWKRYGGYIQWINGFLRPMLKFQFATLKDGSYNVVNIEDVIISGSGKSPFPIAGRTVEMAREIGFAFERVDKYPIGRVSMESMGVKENFEHVLVFRKPEVRP
jgi:hypothetical protein